MIPDFEGSGYLPINIHWATWDEIEERFGRTLYRWEKLIGLKEALMALKECGCKRAYLDGSFVSINDKPNDYDVCYDVDGMNLDRLFDRYHVFYEYSDQQIKKFKGEFKRAHSIAKINEDGKKITYLQFFQLIKNTNDPKGIIGINLEAR